ncbi:MAG: hypothetical protein LBT80_01630 [Lactobacillaceae bacterium]|jgi:hypothetical protein|nr:hypothetical protein [Lactobacillaceae bacterium]
MKIQYKLAIHLFHAFIVTGAIVGITLLAWSGAFWDVHGTQAGLMLGFLSVFSMTATAYLFGGLLLYFISGLSRQVFAWKRGQHEIQHHITTHNTTV